MVCWMSLAHVVNLLLTWTASAGRARFYGVSGVLSIQRLEEIFTSKVGSTDHFDCFTDYFVSSRALWFRTLKS